MKGSGEEAAPSGKLKVAAYYREAFQVQYGTLLQQQYPDVEFDIVSYSSIDSEPMPAGVDLTAERAARISRFIDEQQPDIIMEQGASMRHLIRDGKLLELETRIERDRYGLDGYHPSILEQIRAYGDGRLYGLAPTFNSTALYYNKLLFDQYDIPYPTDGMTWESVITLAARFPSGEAGEERIYGLAPTLDAYEFPLESLVRRFGYTAGLQYYSNVEPRMAFTGGEWERIVQLVVDGAGKGFINPEQPPAADDIDAQRLRIFNRTAMVLSDQSLAGSLYAAEGRNDLPDIDWGVVTVPVNPEEPGSLPFYLYPQEIMTISASADNPDLAWEILKFLNGEQAAVRLSNMKSARPSLLARTAHNPEYGGNSLAPFYTLEQRFGENQATRLKNQFYYAFYRMVNEQLDQAASGAQSILEAMAAIQTNGQALLTDNWLTEESP